MTSLDDLWLRGQAAQTSILQMAAWNAAFVGTASLQAAQMGVTAPRAFWSALSRATSDTPLDPRA